MFEKNLKILNSALFLLQLYRKAQNSKNLPRSCIKLLIYVFDLIWYIIFNNIIIS